MLMTLAFDFAQMKLNYDSTNQWPTLCLESRHHIKRSDSQASYANAPHLAVGWTEDKGYMTIARYLTDAHAWAIHHSSYKKSPPQPSPPIMSGSVPHVICAISPRRMRSTMGPALGHQLRFIVANCGIHDGVT